MRRLLALIATLSLFALAACGGSSSSSDSGGSTDNASVKVGVIPVGDVAPIYLGKAKGIFAKHHIDLTLAQGSGGAALVPAVVSGDYQFAFSNNVSLILAVGKNLPLRMVAEGVSSSGDASTDVVDVLVPRDSSITRPKDLVGKTVGINNVKNINEVMVRYAVEKDGGDPMAAHFVELAFPDMLAAVANHKVDAAQEVEPFLSEGTSQGLRRIGATYAGVMKNFTISSYFTTQQYIDKNPEVVKNFQAAIKESLQYATDHPDEVRQILTTYTSLPADVAKTIKLPAWPQEINVDAVKLLAQLAKKYGLTDTQIDVSKLVATAR